MNAPAKGTIHPELITYEDRKAPGAIPGTLYVPPDSVPPVVDVTGFGPDAMCRDRIERIEQIGDYLGKWPVVWVDVNGLGDPQVISRIGALFHFHRLSLEDVVHLSQRPKIDEYDEHLFFVAQYPLFDGSDDFEQISLFLGPGYVVTFQASATNRLGQVVQRIQDRKGRVRFAGADYLAYVILDVIVDAFFPVVENLDARIEDAEDRMLSSRNPGCMDDVHRMKRELLSIRRAVWGMRDALNRVVRDGHPLLLPETLVYLRDVHDHSIRIIEMAESFRELCASLMDLHVSRASQRMNEIMKVLTIIATIFIPLTFIVGIYGMNFDSKASPLNMPELHWTYGYPLVVAFMLLVALGMLFFFRRKGWLGGSDGEGGGDG